LIDNQDISPLDFLLF